MSPRDAAEPPTAEPSNACAGCGHALSWHFRDVNGVARCTVIRSGVSDRGIIGIPWSKRCGCADFALPAQTAAKSEELSEGVKAAFREAFQKAGIKVPDDDSTKPEI